MKDLRCRYCQKVFQPSAYHPRQTVCSQPPCQRRRRREYHRQKIASDRFIGRSAWRVRRSGAMPIRAIGSNIARTTPRRWNEIAGNSACGTKNGGS